ncbi:MAG: hypothetical protein J5537_11455 [Lachnospiraceae bacterium]|nr:hypothetical protein [Lachnospiraceae bacterium]
MRNDCVKRCLSLVLCAVFLCVSGCGNSSEESIYLYSPKTEEEQNGTDSIYASYKPLSEEVLAIIPEETVTLKVYSELNYKRGVQGGWFGQIIKDLFNVELKFVDTNDRDYFQSVKAGRCDWDFILLKSHDRLKDYIEKGFVRDLGEDDLFSKYGTNINKNMKVAIYASKRETDGKLYGIPNEVAYKDSEYAGFEYHPDIRWDLFRRFHLEEPEEMDDYISILSFMRDRAGESDSGKEIYGATLYSGTEDVLNSSVADAVKAFYGYEDFYLGFFNPRYRTFYGALDDNSEYIKCLEFYNKMYRAGLINPKSREMSYKMVYDSYADGQNLFCVNSELGYAAYNTIEHLADEKMMAPMTFKNQTNLVRSLKTVGGDQTWSIGRDTEYPELCMAILDWMASADGTLTAYYGPKGVCWDYDVNGNTVLLNPGFEALYHPNYQFDMNSGFSGSFSEGAPYFSFNIWSKDTENPESNGQTYNVSTWINMKSNQQNYEIENEWLEDHDVESEAEYLSQTNIYVLAPDAYVIHELPEELASYYTKLSYIVKEGSWRAIYAESEEEFNEVIKDMQTSALKSGYKEVTDWCRIEAYYKVQSNIYSYLID